MDKEELNKLDEITEIYTENNKEVIMGPNQQSKTRKYIKIVALAALVISLVGWLVYFILLNVESKPSGSLIFSLEAPEKAIPGATITYKIHIENDDQATIEDARVRLNYPDGFVYKSASIEPEEGPSNTWLVGQLSPNDSFEIEIQGALLGDSNAPRILFGVINYQLEGFKSRLELSDSVTTFLGDEIVAVGLIGSGTVTAGDTMSLGAFAENLGDETLSDLDLKIVFGTDVNILKVTPDTAINNGEVVWRISELRPGEKKSFDLQVQWSNESSGRIEIPIALEATSLSGVKYALARDELIIDLEKSDITINLEVNGADTNEVVLDGTDVVIVMRATNNTDEDIPISGFRLDIDEKLVDWEQADLSGVNRNVNSLTWSFLDIKAGGNKTVTWVMPILDSVPVDEIATFNFELVP